MGEVTTVLAALLALAGMAGVVVPVLPGTPLIFLAALVYDFGQGWAALGWGWLLVLLALTVAAEVGDRLLGHAGAKRGGASWRAVLVGMVLGVVGTFLFPPFGFLIGALLGVVGTELVFSRDARRAMRAGGGWLVGWLLSLLLQGTVAVVMTAILLWQAR